MRFETRFLFPLVDEVVRATGLSKGKAKKAVLRGNVMVNGAIAKDPEFRVGEGDVVRIDKSVPVKLPR